MPFVAQSQVRPATMAVILGSIAAAGLLGAATVVLRHVLLWIFISFLLAAVLNPLAERLAEHMPRWGAVLMVATVALGTVGGFVVLVLPPFLEQVRALVANAPELLDKLDKSARFQWLGQRFRLVDALEDAIRSAPESVGGLAEPVLHLVGGLFRFGLAVISIFFMTLFMLLNGPGALRAGLHLLTPASRLRAERLGAAVYRALTRYALGTALIALLAGVFAVVVLAALGVPYFLPLGAMVVLLDVIPFAGAITAGVMLTVVAAATVGWLEALIILALFSVYQLLEGHLLLPIVHRRTVRVSALGLVVALVLGVEIAGIVGVLLAVPVAGALMIIAREIWAVREERKAHLAAAALPSPPPGPEPEPPQAPPPPGDDDTLPH